ncbi:hypothetical protein Bhyg_11621 [Pseudolycoriella hygida]|uniref:Uncharacterized protein n=1 Tax=Pseudolycoriella hygida TaxID=35572 RepID=A0A9Q0S0H7_9DIPT|nr:hypothetical protein Bhyg_11621 [Pseudolycoriella hygida]
MEPKRMPEDSSKASASTSSEVPAEDVSTSKLSKNHETNNSKNKVDIQIQITKLLFDQCELQGDYTFASLRRRTQN